ncbi:MAG: phosphocholine cytidylyltransferase family protein [Polyangiaceae bacterium]|nr:phosphocholine cytidylyltransferase family protein [Polyangiaceae bacterium]MCW5791566.1 phosphocholine cytidylyltransferase family protein [Polyangiaceae bacterium]
MSPSPASPCTTTAVILVAGVGSRLRPLTDDRPKALVEVAGETLLGRAVRLLAGYGITRLVLATGYREEAVREALSGVAMELHFCPNPRYASTQNVVSFAACSEAVQEQAFFLFDGDVVFQPELLPRLDGAPWALSVGVDASRRLDEEAMKVQVAPADESGESARILAFGKELALAGSAGESMGVARVAASVSGALFRAAQGAPEDWYYEGVFQQLIEAGELVAGAVDVSDLPWTEVDTLEDLEHARSLLTR